MVLRRCSRTSFELCSPYMSTFVVIGQKYGSVITSASEKKWNKSGWNAPTWYIKLRRNQVKALIIAGPPPYSSEEVQEVSHYRNLRHVVITRETVARWSTVEPRTPLGTNDMQDLAFAIRCSRYPLEICFDFSRAEDSHIVSLFRRHSMKKWMEILQEHSHVCVSFHDIRKHCIPGVPGTKHTVGFA